MINMNNQYKKRLRTVKLNDRGQIVIPEDIRKDLDIKDNTTLIIIEKDGELLLKKESEVMAKMENDDRFWKHFSSESMKRAWGKEDEIWDKFYREPGK
jgi:AbrB family looped-hinge helix DNA binding protein